MENLKIKVHYSHAPLPDNQNREQKHTKKAESLCDPAFMFLVNFLTMICCKLKSY